MDSLRDPGGEGCLDVLGCVVCVGFGEDRYKYLGAPLTLHLSPVAAVRQPACSAGDTVSVGMAPILWGSSRTKD